MPVAGLLSASCKLPRSTHANFCGAQAGASLAPFSSRRAVNRLQGRRAQLRCAADSKSSEQQSKTVRDQLAVAAKQLEARKRKDRGDLFTDNWGGDVWKGSKVNVLSVILAVSILVPLGGLLFAYLTFGTLWG